MNWKALSEAVILHEDDSVIDNVIRLIRKSTVLEACESLISYDVNTTPWYADLSQPRRLGTVTWTFTTPMSRPNTELWRDRTCTASFEHLEI